MSVSSPEKAGVGGSIPSLATTESTTYRPPETQFHSISFQFQLARRVRLGNESWCLRGSVVRPHHNPGDPGGGYSSGSPGSQTTGVNREEGNETPGRSALLARPVLSCAAVPLVLPKWFLTPVHHLTGCGIDNLLEVAALLRINDLLPINDPNLVHPTIRFPVKIIAGETFYSGFALPSTLELVLKAAVQRHPVRNLPLNCLRRPVAPEPHQLHERCPHILAFGNAPYSGDPAAIRPMHPALHCVHASGTGNPRHFDQTLLGSEGIMVPSRHRGRP